MPARNHHSSFLDMEAIYAMDLLITCLLQDFVLVATSLEITFGGKYGWNVKITWKQLQGEVQHVTELQRKEDDWVWKRDSQERDLEGNGIDWGELWRVDNILETEVKDSCHVLTAPMPHTALSRLILTPPYGAVFIISIYKWSNWGPES